MKIATFFDHITQACEQTGKTLEEILALTASYGITGIDISYPDLLKHYDFLMDFCKKNAFAISSVYETFDFSNHPNAARGYQIIDCAYSANVRSLLIIPGFLDINTAGELHRLHNSKEDTFSHMDSMPSVQNIRTALADLTAYAEDKKIAITLEDFDNDVAPFSRTYQLLYFMEKVPGLKTTLDMGNFAYADEDVINACNVLAPYIVHAHCKDRGTDAVPEDLTRRKDRGTDAVPENLARRKDRGTDAVPEAPTYCKGLATVPVGDGYLPIAELVRTLKNTKYDGYYVIEHFDAPDQLAYMKRSADFLIRLLT